MAGIYVHIPFCRQACYYCDFHFSTDQSYRAELIRAMGEEIALQREYLDHEPIRTLYFGGGTPSLLSREELEFLTGRLMETFRFDREALEFTVEANPDDLSMGKLIQLKQSGVNRLSIGIQSFHDPVLHFLNRAHNSASAVECVQLARQAGFENISIDLIYAIPGQSESDWKFNIGRAISLEPEHISAYSLTIEEKTVFGRWASKGRLHAVEDDIAASQLELLVTLLQQAGYEQYEVSNFCRPGFQSRHNSSYWKQEKYLGIGPGAHSFNRASRQFNVANNALYVRSLQQGRIPFELEMLSRHDHINEYLLTTLRTSWGSDLTKLREEFRYDLLARHEAFVNDLLQKRLAFIENGFLKLTAGGRMLADKISADLFSMP